MCLGRRRADGFANDEILFTPPSLHSHPVPSVFPTQPPRIPRPPTPTTLRTPGVPFLSQLPGILGWCCGTFEVRLGCYQSQLEVDMCFEDAY